MKPGYYQFRADTNGIGWRDYRGLQPAEPDPLPQLIMNLFEDFRPEDEEQSIVDRFEQQVLRHGDRLAVQGPHSSLTYTELNAAANRLAHAILARRGTAAEPIALLFEQDTPLIVAIIAVIKAGKFYVPLDQHYPRQRTVAIIEASGAGLLITSAGLYSLAAELQADRGDALDLLNAESLDPTLSTDNPGLAIPTDAYSYLLFTSGSTGRPKGIVECHRNVLRFIASTTNDYQVTPDDRFPLILSPCFSGSVTPLFCPLLNGASLHPHDLRLGGLGGLADWLIRQEITIFWGASSLGPMLDSLNGHEQFPKLRGIHYGAQALNWKLVERYKQRFSDACIMVHALGMTEKKQVTRYFINKQTPIRKQPRTRRYPVDDVEVTSWTMMADPSRLVMSARSPLPVASSPPPSGSSPNLTVATFYPAPEGDGRRVWRTGDLGRMRPDGCIYSLGRKDFQVKIRGHRIELGEVEGAIQTFPDVADAAVAVRDDHHGEPRLVGYVVPARGAAPTVTALRVHLASALPAYMLPSAFVFLDALPRNPNGKVDRPALPEPRQTRPDLATAYVAPRTADETRLVEIWEQVLDVRPIGLRDDFFELGGDSLAAETVFAAIETAFGRDLPSSTLLQGAAASPWPTRLPSP